MLQLSVYRPKDWFVLNVCAAIAYQEPKCENSLKAGDMDVDDPKAFESQQVEDDSKRVKAEMQFHLLDDASKRLDLSTTDYGT